MGKANRYGLLCGLIGAGVMSLGSNALAVDQKAEDLLEGSKQGLVNNSFLTAADILSDNEPLASTIALNQDEPPMEENSAEKDAEISPLEQADNDAVNDYDADKESAAEEIAPMPQEEEDSPLLDEEGNLAPQASLERKQPKAGLNAANLMRPSAPPSTPG